MRLEKFLFIVVVCLTVSACITIPKRNNPPETIMVPVDADVLLEEQKGKKTAGKIRVNKIVIPDLSGPMKKGDNIVSLGLQRRGPCGQCVHNFGAHYYLEADMKELVTTAANLRYEIDPSAEQSVKFETSFNVFKSSDRNFWCTYWTFHVRVNIAESFLNGGETTARNEASVVDEEDHCLSAGLRIGMFPSGTSLSQLIRGAFTKALEKLQKADATDPQPSG